MLTITVGAERGYDESKEEFVDVGGTPIDLEHSLLSLSKWEQEFEIPFLGKEQKSTEQVIAYVRAMTLTEGVTPDLFGKLSTQNFEDVNTYIDRKMTATFFYEPPGKKPPSREVITSELVYYWMTTYHIPFSCETWNLNRLFALIRICNVKQAQPKKMSRGERAREMAALNAQRQKEFKTTG